MIRKVTVVLGALCLVAMILVTCAEVVMRYFFAHPIFGSAEMTQLLFGVLAFCGFFAVGRDRGHVNVSLFEPFLLKRFNRGYRAIFDVMSLIGSGAIVGILGWRLWDLTEYPETTVVLRVPMIWIVAIMALLALLGVVGVLASMRDERRVPPPHSPQSFE
ncbi:TRAP transporter small permease [Pararhodobacter aggregans]|uniref:TRAP transporter small permease n=1 Tax=Pararhodobacter aggregans TaxID=404875 RepID=UPI003A95C063